jgi:predicted NAD/FAD-dependent oxidoreductase
MGALLSRTNVYCLLNFYGGELGPEFDTQRYTFPGGTSALSQGVASTLTGLRTQHVAVRVVQEGEKVHVDCVTELGSVVRYVANHVVMAAPKFQMPNLVPNLPEEQAAACKQLSYAPYMTLHVVSDIPMVEPDVYDTWNLNSEFETDVVNPASVPGTQFKKNVSSLFVPMDRFARGQLQDPDLFARRAADVVDRFVSSRSREQADSVREIYSWGWGHGLVVPTPGSHSGIAQAARKTFGRVVFANADCDASPAIENAVWNGAQAAINILEA